VKYCEQVTDAAVPFSASRSGMILGAGATGMVLETEESALRRRHHPTGQQTTSVPFDACKPYYCRLLATLVSNSAYHGASLDRNHIAEEMERFLQCIERDHGITRVDIARQGVYFSHETSTHASPTQSCAYNEIFALRKAFGSELCNLLILNTKGFTGHAMGVSFEDVVAVEVLNSGVVPPIANCPPGTDVNWWDPALGTDLKFSRGGPYPCKYALRFAAGFGSQIALALYAAS
jgi:3-oxoacyl-(acyl-carrier-protein) synthase